MQYRQLSFTIDEIYTMRWQTIFRLLRVEHWVKNILLFAPLLFALRFATSDVLFVLWGFFVFSLLASAIYIVNDLFDCDSDRIHPLKRLRPIAAGAITEIHAGAVALFLGLVAILMGTSLPKEFQMIAVIYVIINIAYSAFLKKYVVIDVMVIAFGFVLRILAGSAIIGVATSYWILLCTFFGSLFLGFAKRKYEVDSLREEAQHREVFQSYSKELLEQLLTVTSALTIMSYALYTIDDDTVVRFRTDYLFITLGFVVFGLFYYFYVIDKKKLHGDPTKFFLTDKIMLVNVLLWFSSFFAIIIIS